MRLKEKINQVRRDFEGIYICEFCHEEERLSGCYDDRYFHEVVTPNTECSHCHKSTNGQNAPVVYCPTKYPENKLV